MTARVDTTARNPFFLYTSYYFFNTSNPVYHHRKSISRLNLQEYSTVSTGPHTVLREGVNLQNAPDHMSHPIRLSLISRCCLVVSVSSHHVAPTSLCTGTLCSLSLYIYICSLSFCYSVTHSSQPLMIHHLHGETAGSPVFHGAEDIPHHHRMSPLSLVRGEFAPRRHHCRRRTHR